MQDVFQKIFAADFWGLGFRRQVRPHRLSLEPFIYAAGTCASVESIDGES